TLFSCTAARCRSRSPAQDAPADIGNPDQWSRGGDESRPQSTSCRFYAATLMNAGFPVWTSRGEPAFGPEIRRSRATETMQNDASEYDAEHSYGPSFALGGPCPLGCYPLCWQVCRRTDASEAITALLMESWLSGRKRHPAKVKSSGRGPVGSNPTGSAHC